MRWGPRRSRGWGTLVGTPAYLAPERAAGGTATPASDLYSLGVVACECLAGAPPFSGVPLEVLAAHQHAALPPLPRAVPAGAAALIAEPTAKAPAARPASAAEVATQARHLCDAMTLTAPIQLTAGSHVPPATGAHSQSATLRGLPVIDPLPAHRRLRRDRAWRGRAVALAVAAAAVTAGLAGWLLAGAFGAVPQQRRLPGQRPRRIAPRLSTW
jgi:eukaryotic-like serine/threonine-protein kinase